MSTLLWIVFGWMVFGTIISLAILPTSKSGGQLVGRLIGNLINIASCIVIAFAAVAL